MKRYFRRGGAWPNLLIISYTLLGWPLGIWLLTLPPIACSIVGTVLTAHTLICSAYLVHDCIHHSVFIGPSRNDGLARLLGWINGACIADYGMLKEMHLRHHTDRLDIVGFDYRAALKRSPAWWRRMVLISEWAYIPMVELLMRGMVAAAPFYFGSTADQMRVVGMLAIRLVFFAGMAWISPKALLLYAVAYVLFLNVLRFLDAFQHTYEVYASRTLEAVPIDSRRDLRYEYENTYSNLLAERPSWLNCLVLNFAYHNAHHVRPGVPWYRLRRVHYSLYKEKDGQVITCRRLARSFHRHRVRRVLAENYGVVAPTGDRTRDFIGAVGVGFLTPV